MPNLIVDFGRIRFPWSNSIKFDQIRPFEGHFDPKRNLVGSKFDLFCLKYTIFAQIRSNSTILGRIQQSILVEFHIEPQIRPQIWNSKLTFSVEFRIIFIWIRNSSELSLKQGELQLFEGKWECVSVREIMR